MKLRFIPPENMVAQGQLSESEFQQIIDLLDRMDDYDDRQFACRAGNQQGMTDFIDWEAMSKARR